MAKKQKQFFKYKALIERKTTSQHPKQGSVIRVNFILNR